MARKATHSPPPPDPMQVLTNRIITELDKGIKPWVRPWDPSKCNGPQGPFNGATGHRYSVINVLVLGMDHAPFRQAIPDSVPTNRRGIIIGRFTWARKGLSFFSINRLKSKTKK